MNRCRVHSFKSFRVLQIRLLFGDEMVRYSKVYGKKKSEKIAMNQSLGFTRHYATDWMKIQ